MWFDPFQTPEEREKEYREATERRLRLEKEQQEVAQKAKKERRLTGAWPFQGSTADT